MLNYLAAFEFFFFFSSRRRHTRFDCDWSSDVCSSDLEKSREKLSALGYMASGKTTPSTSIDPKDRIDVANDMHDASLAIEEGKEATVIPLLLRVVAKDPQVQAAQYYLGIAYSRQGNFAKAIPPLRKAVELRPDALMPQYELAICFYETGDLNAPATYFEILVENRPDWSDA